VWFFEISLPLFHCSTSTGSAFYIVPCPKGCEHALSKNKLTLNVLYLKLSSLLQWYPKATWLSPSCKTVPPQTWLSFLQFLSLPFDSLGTSTHSVETEVLKNTGPLIAPTYFNWLSGHFESLTSFNTNNAL